MVTEPGFTELLPDKRRAGYGYEYLQEVAFRSGWSLHYVDARRSVLISLFEAGEIDVLMGMTKTEDRERTMLYSSFPQGSRNYFIYTHPYGSGRIKRSNARTVNGARIGVESQSYSRQILEDWSRLTGVTPVIVECDEDQMWEDLVAGRLDGVVDHDLRLNSQEVPMFPLGSRDFYFAVSKNRADLLPELDAALNRIQHENKYYDQQLHDKYLKNNETNR